MESTRKRKPFKQLTLTDQDDTHTNKKSKTDNEEEESERRAGVIKSIVLKNFMCHSLLEVQFINNISIVIGQNGSGKSAILTALIVGLGGKASLTNRGTSIKGFVKAGRNSATIEITLNNVGPMAYRSSLYGDNIIISRHFTASGGSSYKIKSQAGKVVSSNLRELQNITTSLNIQVDNPICVLNQDVSRNFLNSNDPRHKYTLFRKATKLETLADEYLKVDTNRKDSLRIWQDKKHCVEIMQQDLLKMKTKIVQHKSVFTMKEKKCFLQTELLWAKVKDAEEELEIQEQTVEKIMKKCEGFRDNSNRRAENFQTMKNTVKELERQYIEQKNTVEVQSRPLQDLKKTLNKLREIYGKKEEEKHSIKIAIKTKNQDIKLLETEIANVNANVSRVQKEKMKRANDLNTLEDKIKDTDDILQTARNELFQVKSDLDRKGDEDATFRKEIEVIDRKIAQHREKLNALQNETGSSLLLYGRDIPRILQMIEQNRNRFIHAPKGPLGSYIKLKDKKWAVAVEGFLGGGTLSAFAVDNKKDNQVLVDIFRKNSSGRMPTIITSKFFFKKHDVSKHSVQAPSDCVSMYDALEIEDAVVSNVIVDSSGVEGILLIPSDDRAMKLLSDKSRVPRNCQQGVTVKGDRYYPDPNYKTYGSRYHRAQYLQVDTKEYIVEIKQNIAELTKQKQTIKAQYASVMSNMGSETKRKDELEAKIVKLRQNRNQTRQQLEQLRSMAEPEAVNIDDLQNELTEIKRVVAGNKAKIETLDGELKEIKDSIDQTETNSGLLKKAIKSLENRLETLQGEIRENVVKIKEVSTSESFDNQKMREYECRLNEEQATMVIKQSQVQLHTKQAKTIGQRPSEMRKVAVIAEELSNIERAIEQIQSNTEDVNQIVTIYKELGEKFNKATHILAKLKSNLNELETAADIRKRHYKYTENYFITYIKHSFKKILEFRQFKGSININVQDEKLELVVVPQQGSQGQMNTTNLSGGERSFSTVAFLYALWQCMEFPFYFMDEFDVYMDKLNRTKVFDILLHHASTRPQLQFVFLTPQDVSFINKNVTILRLENPERRKV